MLTTDEEDITAAHVNSQLYHDLFSCPFPVINDNLSLQEHVERFERNLLENMLSQCRSAYEVSKILKVNRSTISKKIKKYKIDYSGLKL
jgi:transcriptional regulator with PAS, ATPase and Fis domain